VPALADIQKGVRDALILGDVTGLDSMLVGGHDARKRLAIHQRHYHASLITALLDRFPATVWLVGSEFVTATAREFVRNCPPSRPCIAEYGEEFPASLAARPGAADVPYLQQFGELEWHVGRLSIAVAVPPLTQADLAAIDPAALADATLAVQPGALYHHADWAIDQLISLYLSDSVPDQFSLQPGDAWLEVRGARGGLTINRLTHADFAFRAALAAGERLGDAAVSALDIDPAFDAGQALLSAVADGLVTAIDVRHEEGPQ
jgi:hypothetical protein